MRCAVCPMALAAGQASHNEAPATATHVLADVKTLRSKSTETNAQEMRIVAALKTGPKTTDDLRRLGCYQVSARVFALRRRGYFIETELFNGYAADGYSHARMARYKLHEEPLPLGAKEAKDGPSSGAGDANGAGAMGGEDACSE